MTKSLVAVTIPIYKKLADEVEIVSLQQAFKVLGNYPIIFFAPRSLDTTWYEKYCSQLGSFTIERFDDHYFLDTSGYNRLMLSKHFYKTFSNFKFILIYQLDAFVFKDELQHWCTLNYDYVAAPHLRKLKGDLLTNSASTPGSLQMLSLHKKLFKVLNKIGISRQVKEIENGGLSLRKVSSFIRLLTLFKNKGKSWPMNEDTFYFYGFNFFFFLFELPSEKLALNFSFEFEPSLAYQLNNRQLPFGCHAFMKYEPRFWKTFISIPDQK